MYDQIAANKLRSGVLIVVFMLLVVAVGWAFDQVSGLGYATTILAFIVAVAGSFASYWHSDKIVLGLSRARLVSRETEPYIVNTVEGLAIAAGLPTPRAYIIEDTAPNAFATGRDPEHAAIALTRGLVEKLDRLELEGVIAHELAHIKNFDTRLQTLTAVLAGTVVLASDWLMRSLWWGGSGGGRGKSSRAGAGVLALAVAVVAPLFAALIRSALSRRREYLADANGALLTRYPQGLAEALRKIAGDGDRLRVANKATEPLYIFNPLKDYGGPMSRLFDTHPPIEERIRRLEAM